MSSTPSTARPDVVAAARRIAPLAAAAAERTEAQRRLVPEVVEALREAWLFHTVVPRDLGGAEIDPVTASIAIEEISSADGSAGWCLMIAAQVASLAGFLEPPVARRVFAGRGIVAAVARPIGRAVTSDGGRTFRVTGRWPFASGSSHASWLGGECMLFDGDTPIVNSAGEHASRMFLFPASEVTIHDTWHTTGLRGTASNDISVDGTLAPAELAMDIFSEPRHPWPLYRALALIFLTHGSQAVGIARGAVTAAKEIVTNKPGWGSDRPMRENPRVQATIAEAVVTCAAARGHMYSEAQALWDAAAAGADLTELSARSRLATSFATASAARAVDLAHSLVATSAIFNKSPLERRFRDIHTAAAHVMVGPLTYEAAGRVELGLPAQMAFF